MKRRRVRYVRNDPGFDALATSDEARRAIADIGEGYQDVLRGLVPTHYTDYKDALFTETQIEQLPEGPRWSVNVGSTYRWAFVAEVGSKTWKNPPRPLHKLLDHIDANDPNIRRKTGRGRS